MASAAGLSTPFMEGEAVLNSGLVGSILDCN